MYRVTLKPSFIKYFLILSMIFITLTAGTLTVFAEDSDPTKNNDKKEEIKEEESIIGKNEMRDLDHFLRSTFPNERIQFADLVEHLIRGEMGQTADLLGGYLKDLLFYVLRINKKSLVYLTLVVMLAALFSNFSNVFMNDQIARTGFYIVYIFLISMCLQTFRTTAGTVADSLAKLNRFMQVLGPVYFMGMAAAGRHLASVAFHNVILLVIYLAENVIGKILLPLIHIFMMIRVLNYLSDEEYLTKLSEFIQLVTEWSLKTMISLVTGIGLIQGLLSPSIDLVKKSALAKGVQMIPGVGGAIGGMTEVVLGTAVLIKNGIGVAGALILILICLIPLGNMAVLALAYKGFAALIQPISDKRIVEAVNSIALGCMMLMKVIFTTAVLFLITIAIAAFATN